MKAQLWGQMTNVASEVRSEGGIWKGWQGPDHEGPASRFCSVDSVPGASVSLEMLFPGGNVTRAWCMHVCIPVLCVETRSSGVGVGTDATKGKDSTWAQDCLPDRCTVCSLF